MINLVFNTYHNHLTLSIQGLFFLSMLFIKQSPLSFSSTYLSILNMVKRWWWWVILIWLTIVLTERLASAACLLDTWGSPPPAPDCLCSQVFFCPPWSWVSCEDSAAVVSDLMDGCYLTSVHQSPVLTSHSSGHQNTTFQRLSNLVLNWNIQLSTWNRKPCIMEKFS